MKKIISMMLTAVYMVTISACGSADGEGLSTMNTTSLSSSVFSFTDVPKKTSDRAENKDEAAGDKTLAAYVIVLGYPIWHGQAPKIIYTFLESYDFTGKTIVPFCTSHSSGIGSSDTNLHALAADAEWLSGKRFAGGTSKNAIKKWIRNLRLIDTAHAYDNIIRKMM